MKHIIIRNFGPLQEVDININSINLFIGPQSSGKSCILKIACYCSWVEKRIQLSQSIDKFEYGSVFMDTLIDYHNLLGYKHDNAYIEYESSYLKFSYCHVNKKFSFSWKKNRWNYKRPKISYIPSERNLISVINSWQRLPLPKDFLDFVSDWNLAREFFPMDMEILDQRVKYRYDPIKQIDSVFINKGQDILLHTASSGLQSLIPLFVHLYFLNNTQYVIKKEISYESQIENQKLFNILFSKILINKDYEKLTKLKDTDTINSKKQRFEVVVSDKKYYRIKRIYDNFINTKYNDIYLEEPETNLFPPTQCQLIDFLVKMTKSSHKNAFFITTHSPYVMIRLLEKNLNNFSLHFVYKDSSGKSIVKTASEEDVQEIYDNGVDSFFNIETYV